MGIIIKDPFYGFTLMKTRYAYDNKTVPDC
jgi:hypothetical protein